MTDAATPADALGSAQRAKALTDNLNALRDRLKTVKFDRDAQERTVARLDEQMAAASARAYLAGGEHPDTTELDKARVKLRGLEVAEAMVGQEIKTAHDACEAHRQGVARVRFKELLALRERDAKQAFALMDAGMRVLSRWSPGDPVLHTLPWNMKFHFTAEPTTLLDELRDLRSRHPDVVPELSTETDEYRQVSWYSRDKPAADLTNKIIAALPSDG